MNDLRKRAIQGIESWIEWMDNSKDFDLKKCADCTYNKEFKCLPLVMKDALELIKREEPRVMTKEEIIGWDGYIWFEFRGMRAMKAVLIEHGMYREPYKGDFPTKELNWATYQEIWRGWTGQPTEEQRKAEAWK